MKKNILQVKVSLRFIVNIVFHLIYCLVPLIIVQLERSIFFNGLLLLIEI